MSVSTSQTIKDIEAPSISSYVSLKSFKKTQSFILRKLFKSTCS